MEEPIRIETQSNYRIFMAVCAIAWVLLPAIPIARDVVQGRPGALSPLTLLLLFLLFVFPAVLMVAQSRMALVLSGNHIIVHRFVTREYDRSHFVGFRRTTTWNRYDWRIKYQLVGSPGHENRTIVLTDMAFSRQDLDRV